MRHHYDIVIRCNDKGTCDIVSAEIKHNLGYDVDIMDIDNELKKAKTNGYKL